MTAKAAAGAMQRSPATVTAIPGDDARRERPAPPAGPDPYRTDVFPRGADGKLHPAPGWHTTGPFDFDAWSHNIDWDGVREDLDDIARGALGLMGDGPPIAGAESTLALLRRRRVGDNIHGHHSQPRFLGGADEQELVQLPKGFHRTFHRRLNKRLRGKGVPTVGGVNGTKAAWDEFFRLNEGAKEWAEDVLRQVSRDFDIERGTSMRPTLEKELRAAKAKRTQRDDNAN
jgi:hypothetical protein